MYEESMKAIYGTLEASLLLWTKLSNILEQMGYKRNNYDWFVMKKIVKGKQCTILWNVDDLNMLHVDSDIVCRVLADIDT